MTHIPLARVTLSAVLPFIASVFPASAQTAERETLPATIVPSHYDLAIKPDLDTVSFSGTNTATITVNAPTREIVINADGLEMDKVTLETGAIGTTSYNPEHGQATIRFKAPIDRGQHRLAMTYHGKIGRETMGLFAMDYDTAAGKRSTLATSLEPAGARKVFPGWDEPGLKATYTVTLDAPTDRMAISNMPVARTEQLSATTKRVTFAETPRMSSYLLFFGIGDWERITTRVDGVEIGVVVNRGQKARGRYALGEAAALLHWYNDYFGVRYPLPKLDLIAAPGQISAGSMENWGAILYSQDHLLFDPATSSEPDRQKVFTVVAHEMAHQWFGNLVTMAWWNDLWLNEGFARWMQSYAADALHPDWKMGLHAQSIFERGKAADALPSSHPIVQDLRSVAQAEQAFDDITYDKGAAVVTMLAATIGDGPFRDGVRAYMQAHAYGNTVDADFWTVMQRTSGKPVRTIERDFTTQPGLPLVRVDTSPDGVHLSTGRFAITGPTPTPAAQRWQIPLAINSGQDASSLLLTQPQRIGTAAPTLVNAGQTAYARVLYSPAALAALLPRVPAMAAVDQIGLVQDVLALSQAGYMSGADLLALVERVPATADPVVWQRIADALTSVDRLYGDRPGRATFRTFAMRVLAPALSAIGTAPQPHEAADRPEAREILSKALGTFGDATVIARARSLLDSDGGTGGERQTAQALVAAKADTSTFDAMLARARSIKDPLDKQQIYSALAQVEDEGLARRIAAIAASDEIPAGVNLQIMGRLVQAHPALVWEEVVPHLADPKIGIDQGARWYVASETARRIDDVRLIPSVRDYTNRNVPADVRAPFDGAIAAIEVNARTTKRLLPEIDHWLARH